MVKDRVQRFEDRDKDQERSDATKPFKSLFKRFRCITSFTIHDLIIYIFKWYIKYMSYTAHSGSLFVMSLDLII